MISKAGDTWKWEPRRLVNVEVPASGAEYSASLPEKTKWRAEVYVLSKICRSLHEWQEETASEQSEYYFFCLLQ